MFASIEAFVELKNAAEDLNDGGQPSTSDVAAFQDALQNPIIQKLIDNGNVSADFAESVSEAAENAGLEDPFEGRAPEIETKTIFGMEFQVLDGEVYTPPEPSAEANGA